MQADAATTTPPVQTARQPMPGDAIRIKKPKTGWWSSGIEDGAIGIIQGVVGQPLDEVGNSIMFNHNTFRGPSSKYSKDQTEYVESGGGPGSICTPPSELVDTGENITVNCWRWKTIPQADGGERYNISVPLWEWAPPEKS